MFHVQSYKKFFKNYFRYVFYRLFLTFFYEYWPLSDYFKIA